MSVAKSVTSNAVSSLSVNAPISERTGASLVELTVTVNTLKLSNSSSLTIAVKTSDPYQSSSVVEKVNSVSESSCVTVILVPVEML